MWSNHQNFSHHSTRQINALSVKIFMEIRGCLKTGAQNDRLMCGKLELDIGKKQILSCWDRIVCSKSFRTQSLQYYSTSVYSTTFLPKVKQRSLFSSNKIYSKHFSWIYMFRPLLHSTGNQGIQYFTALTSVSGLQRLVLAEKKMFNSHPLILPNQRIDWLTAHN